MNEKCWLPELVYFDDYKTFDDYSESWKYYQEVLYDIFKGDFIERHPFYKDVRVSVKHYPIECGKEEAFFHVTCKNYAVDSERVPDMRRCERIRWIRAFIENNDCDSSKCEECEGVKVWSEPYKGKNRTHILLEEERYVVILEHRPRMEEHSAYYLLITAFYLDYDNALEKQLKHYEQYKEKQ